MINIIKYAPPSAEQFELVIRGLRNPLKSWNRMDSFVCYGKPEYDDDCDHCEHFLGYFNEEGLLEYEDPNKQCELEKIDYDCLDEVPSIIIGDDDMRLMTHLIKAGASDRKFLRQLPVVVQLQGPDYWWKEVDQYKIGTVTNSTSLMHRLAKDGVSVEDFCIEPEPDGSYPQAFLDTLNEINQLLDTFNDTGDNKYFMEALQMLPQGYMYTKLWSGSYENLRNMYHQRKGHKQPEWHQFCEWIETLPYARELIIL